MTFSESNFSPNQLKPNNKSGCKAPIQFPKVVAAVRAHETATLQVEDCKWAIGDALILECNPPGPDGINNGVNRKLKQAAAELKGLGLGHYCFSYLRNFRIVANSYPAARRLAAVSWSAHLAAGDPETLQAAKKQAERKGTKLTVDFVQRFRADRRRKDEERDSQGHGDLDGCPPPDPAVVISMNAILTAAHEASDDGKSAFKHVQKHPNHHWDSELIKAVLDAAIIWRAVAQELQNPVPDIDNQQTA
jgi:hypothetical protein